MKLRWQALFTIRQASSFTADLVSVFLFHLIGFRNLRAYDDKRKMPVFHLFVRCSVFKLEYYFDSVHACSTTIYASPEMVPATALTVPHVQSACRSVAMNPPKNVSGANLQEEEGANGRYIVVSSPLNARSSNRGDRMSLFSLRHGTGRESLCTVFIGIFYSRIFRRWEAKAADAHVLMTTQLEVLLLKPAATKITRDSVPV